MLEHTSTQTVLVVDDRLENLQFLEQLLQSMPIRLQQAKSGDIALRMMLETIPAVVILDADLPTMDGYQVINAMQANSLLQHIPVLLMTAHLAGQKQNLHHSLLYVVDCLSKPIDPEVFLAKLKTYLIIDHYRDLIRNVSSSNGELLETMEEGILGIDADGRIRFANFSAARLLRMPVTHLVTLYVESLFSEPCRFIQSRWSQHPITRACEKNTLLQIERANLWCADGTSITAKFAVLPAGGLLDIRWILAFRELKKSKEKESAVAHLARVDHLTQLPTRLRFTESVDQAITQAKKHNKKSAVLHVNLDHFRNINESLGYEMGDQLLQSVAKRLRDRFRKEDPIARLDGDEFAILLSEIQHPAFAGIAASKVLESLKSPFLFNGHELFVSASIGIAIYPTCGHDVLSLLKNADIAAERAKLLGRNGYQYFTAEMNKMTVERMMLLQDLHHAIDKGQLSISVTSVVELQKKNPIARQTHLGWNHPKRGLLPFSEFARDAEDAGLLTEISRWMMVESLGRLSTKQQPNEKIVLTLHPNYLTSPDFLSFLHQQLTQFNLSPEQLIIELCETVSLNRQQDCRPLLHDLNQIGIQLAIADFGRGYSSFELIRQLPIQILKLSSSWLSDIQSSEKDQILLRHLVSMANELGLTLWLEGIDEIQQLEIISTLGVQWGSGKIF